MTSLQWLVGSLVLSAHLLPSFSALDLQYGGRKTDEPTGPSALGLICGEESESHVHEMG